MFRLLTILAISAVPLFAVVDFNRDIRPILSDTCYHCHGPDADNQKSDFRLDTLQSATADLGGYAGVVPNKPEASELVARIETTDPDDMMPPPDSKRHLSPKQRTLLRQWIAEGARYDEHWSFKPPTRSEVPSGANPIDHLVRRRLANTGLKPSPPASKPQLIRRLSLDLTGLPPEPADVEVYLADSNPVAYERVVDRLLATPAYGERMAQVWLDAARYADSAGYQNDFKRSQWPWRDWVIEAYNRNLPFDRFSIEQLAGDLLPDADDSTRLATAFNRNHRINNEGGIIPAEFLVEYVADRVETTSTVWLGLTVGCARCHDHKYDPITMRDFYSMFAFFHNIPENGKDGAIAPEPNMKVFRDGGSAEYERLTAAVKVAESAKTRYAKEKRLVFEAWKAAEAKAAPKIPSPRSHYPFNAAGKKTYANLASPKEPARISGRERQVRLVDGKFGKALNFRNAGHLKLARPFGQGGYEAEAPISWSFFVKPGKGARGDVLSCLTKSKRGYRISLVPEGKRLALRFRIQADPKHVLEIRSKPLLVDSAKAFRHVSVTYDGSLKAAGVRIYIQGKPVVTETRSDTLANFAIQDAHILGAGLVNASIDELIIHRSAISADVVANLAIADSATVILAQPKPSPQQRAFLERIYFDTRNPNYKAVLDELGAAQKKLANFEKASVTQVSIMEEMAEPRPTHLLIRGAYDNPDTRETLAPRTFDSLPPMLDGVPRNRLGLAQWLFQDDNPLTARVAVNRYWQMFFGAGLVKTPEDFGSQGAVPTHPELLDWLALEFRDSGWDIKGILKRIAMSETYRQDSRSTPVMREIDPDNALLARGARYRLSAFALRDQALAASGLLVRDRGGPPVMPYQPAGLWEEVSAKGYKYAVAKDSGLYRRSLYTFWRRTVPPPSMMNFDNAGREICSVNVSRTNTPLQAMNLLNDPQFVEAARALGERMMSEATPEARITRGSTLVWGRPPNDRELAVFRAGYADYLAAFRADADSAKSLIAVGNSTPNPAFDPAELAACTSIASILLNLDETVTKE
ncbi:MAG: hypothetical protein ACI8W8_000908 [Rhodothermales bacterium]|jgi:hypothetical protein